MSAPFDCFTNALSIEEIVFVGKLKKVIHGPCQMSHPPRRHLSLFFEHFSWYRYSNVDKYPRKSDFGENTTLRYIDSTPDGLQLQVGAKYAVGAHFISDDDTHSQLVVNALRLADGETTQLCMELSSVPFGWKRQVGGGWVYPGATKPDSRPQWWAEMTELNPNMLKCCQSGRPALVCHSDDITISVSQIIPEDAEKRMAPYGDGQFRITVRNVSDNEVRVPALLVDPQSKAVSWEDSLLIVDSETFKVYIPSNSGKKSNLDCLHLPPKSEVNAIVDCLTFEGDEYWSSGGVRVYLKFCIGNLCQENFFYYYCNAHEKMHQEKLQEKRPTIV